jgi:hypothetical protein
MKKQILILTSILLLALLLPSCKKEDTRPDCEKNNFGTVTISNGSANPYDVYINGTFSRRVLGNTIVSKLQISAGNSRTIVAVQASGYVFTPSEYSTTANILQCNDYAFQIP